MVLMVANYKQVPDFSHAHMHFTCTVLYDQLSFLLRCLGLFLIRNRWLLQIIKKAVSYFKEFNV